jgi:hypothetical protein
MASHYTMFLGQFQTRERDHSAAHHQFRILLEPPTAIETSTGGIQQTHAKPFAQTLPTGAYILHIVLDLNTIY